jgi:hypothetical protein
MTKSYTSWYNIIANLQTSMTKTLSRQNRLQPISEHIATKTDPVTLFIKIEYCAVHRFKPAIVSWMEKPANQNESRKESTGDNSPVGEHEEHLLKGILHHKLATTTLSTAVDAPHNE